MVLIVSSNYQQKVNLCISQIPYLTLTDANDANKVQKVKITTSTMAGCIVLFK